MLFFPDHHQQNPELPERGLKPMFDRQHLLRQMGMLLLLIMAGGSVGYTLVEDGWSLFDGFYMTLITLTTIGFSEVHSLTTAGRVLTVVIIVFGIGAAMTILGQVAQLMMEGDLIKMWRQRSMAKKIEKMDNHVIICGFGRIGQSICKDLSAMGVDCLIIDREDGRVENAKEMEVPVLSGNATTDSALSQAGISRAKILVAALSNDADNLFVALAARDLNPNLTVIARGEDKSIETRMLRAGVDRVVYPAQLGGGQIARLVASELGHAEESINQRRQTDVLGFDLQVYRNFNKGAVTVDEILDRTGALRAVAHIDSEDRRHTDPEPEHLVGEGEAVVLLSEIISTQESLEGGLEEIPLPRDLSLGIPSVDEEHARILNLIHRLSRINSSNRDLIVEEVLSDLREYTQRHFAREERFLESLDYPELEAHAQEHADLISQVKKMESEADNIHPDNLIHLLVAWVRDHILQSDRRYAEYLEKQDHTSKETEKCPS
jgi:voltage-gated potassium channel